MANIENYIELTNQIFWDGYAETLAKENPAAFTAEVADFENLYNSETHVRHDFSAYQSNYSNHA